MLLTVPNHAAHWDFLALMFKIRAQTFDRMIKVMLQSVTDYAYERYVVNVLHKYKKQELLTKMIAFSHFPARNSRPMLVLNIPTVRLAVCKK